MRTSNVLREHWWIKQLETPESDARALSDEVKGDDPAGQGWLSTTMPAQVHDVLLAHGRIPDPRVGKNAAESAWVGEKDWAYGCVFETPSGLDGGPIFLRFNGLDTLVTVYLNGEEVANFDNMHHAHAVDVREHVRPSAEDNALLLVFASPLRFVAEVEPAEGIPAYHYIRKCRSDFGSYLGARPHAVKVGVFDDVVLDLPDRAWMEEVTVDSQVDEDYAGARVRVKVAVGGAASDPGADLALALTLTNPEGNLVLTSVVPLDDATLEEGTVLGVEDPLLWWPRTHGTPNLYNLTVDLQADGDSLDRRVVDFGIRRVTPVLSDPETGDDRFAFEVNGRRIFLRGACWAPLQGMTHCWDDEQANRLLDLVEHGQMNVLRVWGGGSMPPDAFYEACDRRGILIWQDFMFGYGMYPDDDPDFLGACRTEIASIVRRLRSHPSLLLWCGGNENHMGWDFAFGGEPTSGRALFEEVMPEICSQLDPDRLFHPSSPHGGPVPNWPLEGDWHDYTTLTFSPHASVPLYASEIGRVSAPSLTSMRRFMDDEALWPEGHDPRILAPGEAAWPPMWQYRSVNGSWDKIGPIERYPDPVSPVDLIRVLGTAHGEYLRQRVERQRRGVHAGAPLPDSGLSDRRCWGATIWRLNDPWPIIYWSAVDAYQEPKIPYYFLRRAYDPVLLSFERTPDVIWVWGVNDGQDAVSGLLKVRRAKFTGEVVDEARAEVTLAPGVARRCLDTTTFGPVSLRTEFLWATLETSAATYQASYLLIGERYLHLPEAELGAALLHDGSVEITTDRFARQVSLELVGLTGAVFEDNFFDLVPGERRRLSVLHGLGDGVLRIGAVNAEPVVLDLAS